MESDRPTGGARFTRDVGPGDTGVRVSLRRTLPEGGYGDVLGVVVSWDDTAVRIEKRDGTVVVVDPATVIAAKRVPPPPVRR